MAPLLDVALPLEALLLPELPPELPPLEEAWPVRRWTARIGF
jgi:hypothetical protein